MKTPVTDTRTSPPVRIERLDRAPEDFLSNNPEDSAYHRAFQAARLKEFEIGYLAAWRGEQRVAVLPYFLMDFRLDTMVPQGWLKRCLSALKLKVACVGHPSTDLGHLHGQVDAEVLAAANRELGRMAPLIAYKGFDEHLPLEGFVRVPGLPVALLRIQGDYWSSLSSEHRNNLRRKLKKGKDLTFVETDGLDEALIGPVHALYLQTYERAALKFEVLTPAYFRETAPVSRYLLAYDGPHLVGFVQTLRKAPRTVFRYIGLDYARSESRGVYFLLFLKVIEACVRDGHTELETGATTYAFKRYIGSDLLPTWVYYRHRHPVVQAILGRMGFLLEPSEEELR